MSKKKKEQKGHGLKDPYDFSDRYNTVLTPEEEAEFQKSPMANDVYDYDARGAWKAIRDGLMDGPDARGHLGDMFKKPNHPTFSDQSIYHGVDGWVGGHWAQDEDGRTAFTVGETNMMSPEWLQGYFQQIEPYVALFDDRKARR